MAGGKQWGLYHRRTVGDGEQTQNWPMNSPRRDVTRRGGPLKSREKGRVYRQLKISVQCVHTQEEPASP